MESSIDPKLKEIALKVLNQSSMKPDDKTYGFAVVTILMIISIILTCIRVIQECHKNKLYSDLSKEDKYSFYKEEIKTYSIKHGWFTKMRIKKILRKEMSKEDYNKYSISIMGSLLNTGENLTEDEVITLVEAANV